RATGRRFAMADSARHTACSRSAWRAVVGASSCGEVDRHGRARGCRTDTEEDGAAAASHSERCALDPSCRPMHLSISGDMHGRPYVVRFVEPQSRWDGVGQWLIQMAGVPQTLFPAVRGDTEARVRETTERILARVLPE